MASFDRHAAERIPVRFRYALHIERIDLSRCERLGGKQGSHIQRQRTMPLSDRKLVGLSIKWHRFCAVLAVLKENIVRQMGPLMTTTTQRGHRQIRWLSIHAGFSNIHSLIEKLGDPAFLTMRIRIGDVVFRRFPQKD